MTVEKLKLRAKDAEDIQVISAVLQDSIVPVCDIAFDAEGRTFVVVAQRLCHEKGEEALSERMCCALTIVGVKSVQTHGIDPSDDAQMLDLLALILEPSHCLTFIFAGDARIKLELEAWAGAIEDFGEPWPALCHPCHDSDEETDDT